MSRGAAEALPFEVDDSLLDRTALGLVVLANEQTTERELQLIAAATGAVDVYTARTPGAVIATPERLAALEREIEQTASWISIGPELRCVALACTAGAMVIGEERMSTLLAGAHPRAATTNPLTAAIAGLRALGAARVALITPYREPVHGAMRDHLEQNGIAVAAHGSFQHEDYDEVSRISVASLRAAAERLLDAGPVDAVFLSCTSLRAVDAIESLEQALGTPVVSSNQALAWHALRLAGRDEAVPGFGRLLRTALP
ncbi:aspartate/glutamate racemase family protein [Conexibacter arvalis]|uniref:Maleate isomerase n=1 Tax=Conexibacter arvalis TaxID=912552 RepID=A0A840I8Z2_9ACTN|nr:maleate isomerase [Conexibacter arvalis]